MEEPIQSLEEFKGADQTTRDYFLYEAIRNIPRMNDLEKVFAAKWTEKLLIGAGSILGVYALYKLADVLFK